MIQIILMKIKKQKNQLNQWVVNKIVVTIKYDPNNINENKYALEINTGHILLVDSVLDNINIVFNNSLCYMHYNNRLKDNQDVIAKLMIICGNSNSKQTNFNYMFDVNYKEMSHLSATKILLKTQSTSYFPGEYMQFNYEIMDKYNNIISHNETLSFFERLSSDSIQMITVFQNEELGESINLYVDNTGIISNVENCAMCVDGAPIPDINLINHVGKTFNFSVGLKGSKVLSLVNNYISLYISGCPIGYGADNEGYFCDICDDGKFHLEPNNASPCNPCSNVNIECREQTIYFSYNHWMDFDSNGNIISVECPNSQCCMLDECNYLTDTKFFCTKNRNSSINLCGACNNGYSEAMNASKCVICNQIAWKWFGVTFLLALAFSIFILISKSEPIQSDAQNIKKAPKSVENINTRNKCCFNFAKLKDNKFRLMVSVMIFKVITYHEQAIAIIISSNPLSVVIQPFISIFDFNFQIQTASNDDNDLWCLFDGLTAKQKVLTSLINIGLITSFIFISKFIFCSNKITKT
eukprot:290065_1